MNRFVKHHVGFTDLIFEGRNKKYGAYVLRTEYDLNLARALGIMVLTVSIFTLAAWRFSNREQTPVPIGGQTLPKEKIFTLPVDLEPKTDNKKSAKKKSTAQPEKPSAQPNAQRLLIADHTDLLPDRVSPANDTILPPQNGAAGDNGNDGSENGQDLSVAAGSAPDTIFFDYQTDAAPEYEGGLQALIKFVSKKVRYPRQAADEGIEGFVMVRFVVDETGRVGKVSIKSSSDERFNAEALRVVSLIPDFKKPGYAGGQPVKVYYELPLRFQLGH